MAKHRKKKAGIGYSNRTPISGHSQRGKELLPPFLAMMPGMTSSSWMNDRLPEMVWAALLRVELGQERALGLFRRFLNFIIKHPQREELFDLTLTGLSRLPENLRKEVISFIVEPPQAAAALQPLRLFKALPARETWHQALPDLELNIELLMDAVGATLWHQSQESTDCRWLRVMAQVFAGRIRGIPEETAKELNGYPNVGDQQKVRPSIRAMEIMPSSLEPPDLTWPNAFWDEGWANTPCLELRQEKPRSSINVALTRQHLRSIVDLLRSHWKATHCTTSIDPRHDGVFGMAFYSLAILEDLFGIGMATSIIGRLGLRTILETHINLRFLIQKGDEMLWKKWRAYGAGQAKLASLKFEDLVEPPKHIDLENLNKIANEDFWEEFVSINMASWSGIDLRRMSEQSASKATYDQHYGWTSGYAHGMWGPIREACFRTCGNPLHRLHRYPDTQSLPDVIYDAASLVDRILIDLDKIFPRFEHRLIEKTQTNVTTQSSGLNTPSADSPAPDLS
jgi:Family of unknown function (DUF5677)